MKHLPAEPFNHKEHKRLPFQEVARPVSSRYNRNVHDLLLASGLWTGFYTYAKLPEEHPMELRLQFNNGTVSGDGTDGVGPFVIHGTYNSATGSARWIKTYTGSHDVHYEGTLDGTGLNGAWNIASLSQGTFRIWPRHFGNGEHG